MSSLVYFTRKGNSSPILSSICSSLVTLRYTLCNALMMSHTTIHARYYFWIFFLLLLTLEPSPYLYPLNTMRPNGIVITTTRCVSPFYLESGPFPDYLSHFAYPLGFNHILQGLLVKPCSTFSHGWMS